MIQPPARLLLNDSAFHDSLFFYIHSQQQLDTLATNQTFHIKAYSYSHHHSYFSRIRQHADLRKDP